MTTVHSCTYELSSASTKEGCVHGYVCRSMTCASATLFNHELNDNLHSVMSAGSPPNAVHIKFFVFLNQKVKPIVLYSL